MNGYQSIFSTVFGPSHLMVESSSEEARFQTLFILRVKNIQITALWFWIFCATEPRHSYIRYSSAFPIKSHIEYLPRYLRSYISKLCWPRSLLYSSQLFSQYHYEDLHWKSFQVHILESGFFKHLKRERELWKKNILHRLLKFHTKWGFFFFYLQAKVLSYLI